MSGATASDLIHTALQDGMFPSLKAMDVNLALESARASLTQGLLGGMHELRLTVECKHGLGPQMAALGLVRQLPALATLELNVHGGGNDPVQWPPFLPPALKALHIDGSWAWSWTDGLLPALPGMLGASGARLERLELTIAWQYEFLGDGLVHVAQALRCCSPTLKALHIASDADDQLVCDSEAEDYEDQKALLRVEWTELLAGVSACRELQVLKLPAYVEAESLFPPGTAFPRLTHLEIGDDAREHPLGAGGVELWEVMASGGLPALANLWVTLEGREGGMEEVRSRVAPGLEAVAGTLTHLRLGWRCNEVSVGHELGVAVGKLRRLEDLALDLSDDGRVYHAFARGVAGSGGGRPLPLVRRRSRSVSVLLVCPG
jgi:hypothetical protein